MTNFAGQRGAPQANCCSKLGPKASAACQGSKTRRLESQMDKNVENGRESRSDVVAFVWIVANIMVQASLYTSCEGYLPAVCSQIRCTSMLSGTSNRSQHGIDKIVRLPYIAFTL